MPLAISLKSSLRHTGRVVLSGLSSEATPTPAPWAKAHIEVETLVGPSVRLASLREALTAFSPDFQDDRAGATDWVAPDEKQPVLSLDLLIPLMILARDLEQLGDRAEEVIIDAS